MGWSEHDPFLDTQLVEALMCIFAQAGDDPSVGEAETLHDELRVLLQLQTNACDEVIPYSLYRSPTTVIIADAHAGFPVTKYDWCGMGIFLQAYAQYRDVQELNTDKNLNFFGVGPRLGPILARPERGITFHIFWSPRGNGER